ARTVVRRVLGSGACPDPRVCTAAERGRGGDSKPPELGATEFEFGAPEFRSPNVGSGRGRVGVPLGGLTPPARRAYYTTTRPESRTLTPRMRSINGIFLAPTAAVAGDVTCGPGVNVWFAAVVRGDVAPVRLGENVNLQD